MKRFSLILLLILPLVSCNDFLEEVPRNTLSEANFYTTLEEAEAAVFAIYDPIRATYFQTYFQQTEIRADYAYGRGSTFPIGGEYIGLDVTNIGRVGGLWASIYRAVSYANIAIEKIPGIEADESKKDALVAEARFLRAFCYYQLVRNWGAVPLRLNTGVEDIGRAPKDEVYDAIFLDLQAGENQLPSTPAQYGRPTKWAAMALLADAYLTTEKWELAREKAGEVIQSEQFSLVEVEVAEDFDKIFGFKANGTQEEIFYIKYSRENGWNWPRYGLWKDDIQSQGFGGFVYFSFPDNPFVQEWDDNDLRKQFGVSTEYMSLTTGEVEQLPPSYPVLFGKFRDIETISKAFANDYPALRYADVLLIYAEAASQESNGPTTEAIESLNKIKRRAYGYPSDLSSPVDYIGSGWTTQSFRDTVIQERAYEFISEGKRWFDLTRTGTVEEIILAHKGKIVNKKMLLWPLPQGEIDTNSLINQEDQNPGY